MAERHELLRGEGSVRELVAKEHADERRHGETTEDARFLKRDEVFLGIEEPSKPRAFELQILQRGEIAKDYREPGAPDEELEEHHHRELEAQPGAGSERSRARCHVGPLGGRSQSVSVMTVR